MVQSAFDRLPLLRLGAALLAGVVSFGGCAVDSADEGVGAGAMVALGPVDGTELPPTDLDRIQVGQTAPDFTLTSLAGPPVTLSSFRGAKDVVLVFYRGHW
jgi:hypothetical protein